MELRGRAVVVTGGANGIGRALARRFAKDGARVIVSDIDKAGAELVAAEIGGPAVRADVAHEADVRALVEFAIAQFGAIDLFCSNAGIMIEGGEQVANTDWQRIMSVNVMAHIYAARAVLPAMLERGEGYFLQTVSAAGLLTQIGSAPYSVSKHAALAFAEWLAVTYGDRGIRVSALCPQGVRTNMLLGAESGEGAFLLAGALEPEFVADEVVKGIREEKFLILPHPEVAEYFRRKANDYDRWLRGMRRLQASVPPSMKSSAEKETMEYVMASDSIMQQPLWNFEQEQLDEPADETTFNLRAYFDRMKDEKLQQYRPEWTDEQMIEWDGNFTEEGNLLLGCSERDVNAEEYRRVFGQCIEYRNRVRGKLK
jgi:NAD(P)-dependent dehydrogenase (short-subunit alcohol dehydrogenase family)